MYFTLGRIQSSLQALTSVEPIFGLDFLVCKRHLLPVGRSITFPINSKLADFMDQYYKPDPTSSYYYRVFRTSDYNKHWLTSKYPSGAAQSVRTRGTIADAFLHERGSKLWGWVPDYVSVLKANLYQGRRVPVFDLAVWLYREHDWLPETRPRDVIETFIRDFYITEEELGNLFDDSLSDTADIDNLFQSQKVTWNQLHSVLGSPPDATAEEGGTLTHLELHDVGPARDLVFEPAPRINLITGDNGLGKTFLLECVWWSLTGRWASGTPAYPRDTASKGAHISFKIAGDTDPQVLTKISYDRNTQRWPFPKGRPTIPGLLIYALVDGSYAVWDPVTDYPTSDRASNQNALVLSPTDAWDGLSIRVDNKHVVLINGLISDLVRWQVSPKDHPFNTFKQVLRRLSPSDLGILEPGKPIRLPSDDREFPTIHHPYGDVPIIHLSAGVRRIVTLAYLLVWAWDKHNRESEIRGRDPQRRMVVLVDEIEAHLHPKWQRLILPALLDVEGDLSSNLSMQLIVATHSPLVMASAEPLFEEERDGLFHLGIMNNGLFESDVHLSSLPFFKRGVVDAWLTSDVFELRHARSAEAEAAIEKAKALQLADQVDPRDVSSVSDDLLNLLAADDEFWPRWTYFAAQYGVEL